MASEISPYAGLVIADQSERADLHHRYEVAKANEVTLQAGDVITMGRESGLLLVSQRVEDVGRAATFFASTMSEHLRQDETIADVQARLEVVDTVSILITDLNPEQGTMLSLHS